MNAREIINIIKEVALSQEPVKSVYNGDVYEEWNTSEVNFGSLDFALQSVLYEGNLCTYTFIFYYGDRLLQDKSNVDSVITDGINSIQAVINILNNQYELDISENITYTPFQQQFCDYLAGVYATVNITSDSPIGLCSINKYEYINDKDRLIAELIEMINRYRIEDEQLSVLLQSILHKIIGDGTVEELLQQ